MSPLRYICRHVPCLNKMAALLTGYIIKRVTERNTHVKSTSSIYLYTIEKSAENL